MMLFVSGFMAGVGVSVLIVVGLLLYTRNPMTVSDQKRSEL